MENATFSVFPTNQPQIHSISIADDLKHSFILDNGGFVHICNDRSRFIKFSSERSRCKTGDSYTDTQGVGKVRITMKRPQGGTISITLGEVLYAPGFHTNIVSERRLSDKGLVFDRFSDQLCYRNEQGR